jgi:cytochrome P450
MRRECPFAPPAQYAELRADGPLTRVVLPDGGHAWLVLDHECARFLLADPRVSANRADPAFPGYAPGLPAKPGQGTGFLLWMDPPDHTRFRRMVTGEFTARRMQALRGRLEEITADCIAAMRAAGPPVDLVTGLSLPLPSLAICELLGVPYADRAVFQAHTSTLATDSTHEEKAQALGALRSYLGEIVAAKADGPSDDLLSRLAATYREAGIDDLDHLTGQAMFLLMAGHETTANMISLSVTALLDRPGQLAQLRSRPELVRSAVEELLRFFSITDPTTSRVALEDIELGGRTIRRGDGIIAANAAANHDERVFPGADVLDITRDARGHVAFGYGIHQCLGQNLARLELEIVLTTLFDALPGLRLAVPADRLPYKQEAHVFGIHEVPVTW